MPTDKDVYAPERWRGDALFAPEVKMAYRRLLDQGWTDAIRHLHPTTPSILSGSIGAGRSRETLGFESTISC